jgi:hypothetical protein
MPEIPAPMMATNFWVGFFGSVDIVGCSGKDVGKYAEDASSFMKVGPARHLRNVAYSWTSIFETLCACYGPSSLPSPLSGARVESEDADVVADCIEILRTDVGKLMRLWTAYRPRRFPYWIEKYLILFDIHECKHSAWCIHPLYLC